MRICTWADPKLSGAMKRVDRALADNLPAGHIATNRVEHSDLVVLHTIGYPETVEAVSACHRAGRRYVVMQ